MLAALLFSTPALAFSDPCNSLPEKLSTDDAAWLEYDLKNRFPIRDGKILAEISIEESGDKNLLGPILDTERKRIFVPTRYFQTQCRMVLLQLLVLGEPENNFNHVKEDTRACIKAGDPKATCFNTAIMNLTKTMAVKILPVQSPEFSAALFVLALESIRFQLAHEAGHALINAKPRAEQRDIDTELEADILAQMSTLGESFGLAGPLYGFASASLVDDVDENLHDSAFCRLGQMREIVQRLGLPIFEILGTLANDLDLVKNKDSLAILGAMAQQDLVVGQPQSNCRKIDDRRFVDISDDLEKIASATYLDVSNGNLVRRDFVTIDSNLKAIAPKTPTGSRLLKIIQLSSAIQGHGILEINGSIDLNNPNPKVFEKYINSLDAFNVLLKDEMNSFLKPKEYSSLLLARAVATYFTRSPNSSLLSNTRELRDALEEVETIDPLAEAVARWRYVDRLFPNMFPAPQDLIGRVTIELLPKTMLGDCAGALRYMLKLSEALGKSSTGIPLDASSCATMGRDNAQRISKLLGWNHDLQ